MESNHRKLLIPFNLTYPQLRVLWIIDAFPGITSSRLSKLAYLAPSTVNVIVKNLYGKEIIYKEKSELKNSLFLYISSGGEELLVKEFNENQKSFLIYKDIDFLSTVELSRLNKLIFEMNITLENDMVKAYIEETFNVIEKRIIWIDSYLENDLWADRSKINLGDILAFLLSPYAFVDKP